MPRLLPPLVGLNAKHSWMRSVATAARASIPPEARLHRANNMHAIDKMRPWREGLRRTGVVGFKLGMMNIYDQWGRRHPVTVLRVSAVVMG